MSEFRQVSILWLFLAWLAIAVPARAVDAPTQDLQQVHSQGVAFLHDKAAERFGSQASVTLDAPDSRLRLLRCFQGLTPFMSPGATLLGSTTIGMRCAGPQTWTIYLPGRVSVWRTVAVTSRPLARGQILTRDDFEMQERDLGSLTRGFIESSDEVLGMEVKRPLAANVPLSASALRAPVVIQRGEIVSLVSRSPNLEVKVRARALSGGVVGQPIEVENTITRKRLNGVVYAPGVVRTSAYRRR